MDHNPVQPREFLESVKGFLNRLSVEYDAVELKEHPLHTIVSIRAKDPSLLIGVRGETLHALNHLLKRMFLDLSDDNRFLIDVNGYHENKLAQLREQAEAAADRVRAFKHEVEMQPMNAYERMVVHSLFADDTTILSNSTGEGKFRRVVLQLKALSESN